MSKKNIIALHSPPCAMPDDFLINKVNEQYAARRRTQVQRRAVADAVRTERKHCLMRGTIIAAVWTAVLLRLLPG